MGSAAYEQLLAVQELDVHLTQLRHRLANHPLRAEQAQLALEQAKGEGQRDEIEGRRHELDRNLRRLAWHLVESLVSLPAGLGLKVDGPAMDGSMACVEPAPESMEEIAARYEQAAASLLSKLKAWNDADLLKEDTIFGHLVWAKGYSLQALEMHQAHHRGQMTVLMRQAGLRLPEFYGPVLEGWAAMGVPAPMN